MNLFKFFAVLLFLSWAFQSQGQESASQIFVKPEISATYPGGLRNFYKFIEKELNFPKDARKDKTVGKVFVQFVINEDGSVDDESVSVLKGLRKSCDDEIVRVIRVCPDWIPGTRDGKPIQQRFVLPVNFDGRKLKVF